MKTYIKGNYKRSIFSSSKGYVIGLFKVKDTNDEEMMDYINKTITFTGYFADLNEEDTYLLYGESVIHPKYGFQYQVNEYERVMPEDKDGIIEFLSSDLFVGIGVKLATKIVEILGEHTLEKILENKDCLKQVPKISSKKIDIIYDTLTKYEESHKTIVYLTELGFNMKDSLNIYNRYRGNTFIEIENNIFSIIDEVDGISFLKVDEISNKLGFEPNDERRIKACIVYMMKELTFKNGDTYLYKEEILKQVVSYLKIDLIEKIDFIIDELRFEGKIIQEENKYYLKELYDAENYVTKKIKKLLEKDITPYKKLHQYIKELENYYQITYGEQQKEAIQLALENNVSIINGGPGTGKTTIIKAIVEIYQNMNDMSYDELIEKVALLAPTGRASKRMSESTNLPATTIHRFLKWNKDNNSFSINEYNKTYQELIIIDEVSMIDISLLENLMKGLTDSIKIIFVGDYNQLPSVGPGQILRDFIESDKIPRVELKLLYRQSEDSYINTLALEIKNNELSENYLETKYDYTFLKCNSDSIPTNMKQLCSQILEKGYDYKRVQLMAPMYAGLNGIHNLNKVLQEVFNPSQDDKEEITYGDIIFRENDKILQLVNMPDENVFNGDIGVITRIIKANKSGSTKNEIYVDYDGIIVKYLPKDFVKITHGYIISIHKSQGSEFELVILPICKSYFRMLYRKIIYTAITRAKSKLILLGEPDAFVYGVSNNNEIPRKSGLKEKLQNMYK